MPHFYFDLCDAKGYHPDPDGCEFASVQAASTAARRTLATMAQDMAKNEAAQTVVMVVKDDARLPVYTTTLTMSGLPLTVTD